MPQTLPPPPISAGEPTPNRKRWTRRDCEFLVNNGLLVGRYELIDGEIISKMGQNAPHSFVINRFNGRLIRLFGEDFVRIQSPIDVADADRNTNDPEPDAAVTRGPATDYAVRQPGPQDVLLVVEVADTTLRYDTTTKAALYARAGIPDYWVVDVNGRRLLMHRSPQNGVYQSVVEYAEGESVAPLENVQASVMVGDLLPPVSVQNSEGGASM